MAVVVTVVVIVIVVVIMIVVMIVITIAIVVMIVVMVVVVAVVVIRFLGGGDFFFTPLEMAGKNGCKCCQDQRTPGIRLRQAKLYTIQALIQTD
ncbi:hypothetical protein AK812_SmicGene2497 [Symbiodinium microadriaticum]|uniref:Uncharacterized protein n=1 Tax=Symbiodinium microadriaticum TaxID=2951 RepID=A0A1Q9F1D6_SYMMI|nr:hypothetical protein AK812_SmicGene2497 [Symbiodinium microadriaticum]